VVRGAVMYGIEKAHHEKRNTPWKFKSSYGIMLTEPFSFNSHISDRRWDNVTNMAMASTTKLASSSRGLDTPRLKIGH